MTGGYTGKILRLNLTNRSMTTLDTAKYEEFGGGLGMGTAIFWDLAAKDLPFDAYDPRNVVTLMGSAFTGTAVPSAGSRCEVNGVGSFPMPIWFTRSNVGGRFSAQMKYAGWDGIVIEGKADKPVWVNIINDKVTFEDASKLWGLGTIGTQEEIWRMVTGNARFGEWIKAGDAYTTQRPAVMCIGPAGEKLSRLAVLLHDLNGAGHGGFGAVWGSKNLKAVSVIGTGSTTIANPKALMDARLWFRNYSYDVDAPVLEAPTANMGLYFPLNRRPGGGNLSSVIEPSRPQGCLGCPMPCRLRSQSGYGNEASCSEAGLRSQAADRPSPYMACDLIQDLGLTTYDLSRGVTWLTALNKLGIVGPGKKIDTDLDFTKVGKYEFWEKYCRQIAYREGIGADLAEGPARAAVKWGRWQEDTDSGLLPYPHWGIPQHYEPRVEVEWGYGSILGDRDINEHSLNFAIYWWVSIRNSTKELPFMTAEKLVNAVSSKMVPYQGDPFMLDYSEGPTGIYSDNRAKTIAWHRHYTSFWTESMLYCDWRFPEFVNGNRQDFLGFTPEAEPKFYNAVTGKNITFADGMEMGRKIWNLRKAIWTLQGRHRDQEVLAGYVYTVPTTSDWPGPVYENGQWKYGSPKGRTLNKAKFEEWKTKFYAFEGWDTSSGWPKRKTLEDLGLKNVADALEAKGKLGKA